MLTDNLINLKDYLSSPSMLHGGSRSSRDARYGASGRSVPHLSRTESLLVTLPCEGRGRRSLSRRSFRRVNMLLRGGDGVVTVRPAVRRIRTGRKAIRGRAPLGATKKTSSLQVSLRSSVIIAISQPKHL